MLDCCRWHGFRLALQHHRCIDQTRDLAFKGEHGPRHCHGENHHTGHAATREVNPENNVAKGSHR